MMNNIILFTCAVIVITACSNVTENCCEAVIIPPIKCDYYINDQLGNDNNSGDSEKQPWQSITKVSQYSLNPGFEPGVRICFKRGQRFYTFFNGSFNSSGLSDKPIIISNYGDSNLPLPLLSTARRINQKTSWKKLFDGKFLYEGYQGCAVNQLWEEGKPLKKTSSELLLDGQ